MGRIHEINWWSFKSGSFEIIRKTLTRLGKSHLIIIRILKSKKWAWKRFTKNSWQKWISNDGNSFSIISIKTKRVRKISKTKRNRM